MSWNCADEKLLCHIVLNDRFAKDLSSRAGPAFFRGFIVQDRATGIVSMKFRFRYEDDDRQWYEVKPKEQGPGTMDELRTAMLQIMVEAAALMHKRLPAGSVEFFYPPDDGGQAERTIAWLKEQDLIEVLREERVQ